MEFIQWLEQSWVYFAFFAGALVTIKQLFKNIKDIKKAIEAPQKAQDEKIAKLEEKVELIQDGRVGCSARWEHIDATEERFEKMFENSMEAQTALLRDRINSYFDRCNDKGYLSKTELEIVTDLYKAYHKMGGNGLISREMEIINKFPVFDNEEDYQHWKQNKKGE